MLPDLAKPGPKPKPSTPSPVPTTCVDLETRKQVWDDGGTGPGDEN